MMPRMMAGVNSTFGPGSVYGWQGYQPASHGVDGEGCGRDEVGGRCQLGFRTDQWQRAWLPVGIAALPPEGPLPGQCRAAGLQEP